MTSFNFGTGFCAGLVSAFCALVAPDVGRELGGGDFGTGIGFIGARTDFARRNVAAVSRPACLRTGKR